MKFLTKFGATSNMVRLFIQDSSSSTGAGLSTVVYNSSGLVIDVICNNASSGGVYHYKSAATATIQDIGTSGSTCGTYSAPSAANCRFAPVDTTNFPGLYEIQFLDGLFDDSGATSMIIKVSGVTNMAPTFAEIQLVAFDPNDSVRAGLTALPNVAPGAANGLLISGANTGPMSISNGVTFAGTASNNPGLTLQGNGGGAGLYAVGGATGDGAFFYGGSGSGDGVSMQAQTSGAGLSAVGAGGGSDIDADITGNLSGNVTGTVAGVTPSTAAQVAAVLTTQITEAYRANGAAPTLAQFMSEVLAHLGEAAISGTTKTINKLDHVTPAATFTLDSATDPATIQRAS